VASGSAVLRDFGQNSRPVKKEEFRDAVRALLQEVPAQTRRAWDETHLFGWWLETSYKDPNVTWGSTAGTLWTRVKTMCADLIGPDAL
jgi:hypothetical protein